MKGRPSLEINTLTIQIYSNNPYFVQNNWNKHFISFNRVDEQQAMLYCYSNKNQTDDEAVNNI